LIVIDCSAMIELPAAKMHTGDAIARRVTSAQTLDAPYVLDGEQDVLPLWPRLKNLHANLSAYDAQYVALAETLRVPLITADARIERSSAARYEVEVFDAHT
jgi:predicted nucleic acid-binding protein